ncbi:UNVERIFIED_CONTAM: hypothetical protein NCL1_35590 [Trichonephila clavipes]
MVRREPEDEKRVAGTPRDLCHISEKLDNCPRLRLSECTNQKHKEEKSFVKEKKRKTSSKSTQSKK